MTSIFVEVATVGRSGGPVGPWYVREGSSRRGGASCNLRDRVIEVPVGSSPVERVVRAHELTHARVSPSPEEIEPVLVRFPWRIVECAEEFRVNWLLARTGFDVTVLADGSERDGGRDVANRGDWREAVCFFAAVKATGGEAPFLRGVRRERPAWSNALRSVGRVIDKVGAVVDVERVRDTRRDGDGLPRGFATLTLAVSEVMARAIGADVPEGREDRREFERGLRPGARRPSSGRFADLVTADLVDSPAQGTTSHRRKVARNTGRDVRRPDRWCSDAQRRIFVEQRRSRDGVVLIDLSGSMDLASGTVEEIVRAAPGATVLAYSHRPGDVTGSANSWILARGGRVARSMPAGNVGNGVDGPALRWALSVRRPGEPVIWVTDGQVTDSNDRPGPILTDECARLALGGGVRLVREPGQVPAFLRTKGRRTGLENPGRVGQRMRELLIDQEV